MDGGIGTRGPGESQIETDRRLARNRISALRRRLEQLEQQPRRDAGPARPLLAAAGRPRRLHERRQVDAAERADRRRGRGGGQALPHPRPDHPQPRALRPRLPADRHGRLHREAAPPAGRGLQGDARGDRARRPDPARRRRLRAARAAPARHARGRRGPRGDRRRREAAAAGPQQGRPARRGGAPGGRARPSRRGARLGGRRRGARRAAGAGRGGLRGDAGRGRAARPLRAGRPAARAARGRRQPRAHRPRGRRPGPRQGPGRRDAPLRRSRRRRSSAC